jgi:hypothetical protein
VVCLELTLALPWSIEINGSKISFLLKYLFIEILCVKMSRVDKALECYNLITFSIKRVDISPDFVRQAKIRQRLKMPFNFTNN